MATINVKSIFEHIQSLNAAELVVSSMGTIVTQANRVAADSFGQKIGEYLPESSLAYKILNSTSKFSEKQLWVISYELLKSVQFCNYLSEFKDRIDSKERFKIQRSKDKLAANKQAAQPVLDMIKASGKLLGDYYKFLKSTRKYVKEYYSKKYSNESAQEFLAI